MADPFSIATGVVALLQVSGKVVGELKKLHDGAAVVQSTIAQLQHDVESLQMVLESMRKAFEYITAEQSTGHIGSLWDGVARSVVDGKQGLEQLHSLVAEMNRDSRFLDEYRKQLRLMRSEEKISRSRMHIQSCRDTLQLSLQTIILVNQHSYKTVAEDQVVPSLTELQKDVRRIAHRLNDVINTPPVPGLPHENEADQTTMKTLLECVRSAASVISDASTVVPSDKGAGVSRYGSGATNYLPPHRGLAMRRWFDSRTVYSYVDAEYGPGAPPESVAEVPALDNDALDDDDGSVDSDTELQNDMTRLLLDSGKRKLANGSFRDAERVLLNSLDKSRTASAENKQGTKMQLEAMDTLYDLYVDQDKLTKAEDMLVRRMAIRERATTTSSLDSLSDVLTLAKLSKQQNKTAAAHLHGRRALKGYRKLHRTEETRSCLVLLITLCKADGSESDLEAYDMMLDALETASTEAPDAVSSQQDPAGQSSEDHAPPANSGLSKAMAVSHVPEQEAVTVTDHPEVSSLRNRSYSLDFYQRGRVALEAPSTDSDGPTDSSVPPLNPSRVDGANGQRTGLTPWTIPRKSTAWEKSLHLRQIQLNERNNPKMPERQPPLPPSCTLQEPDTDDISFEDALERQDSAVPALHDPPKRPIYAEEESNVEKEFLCISYCTQRDWHFPSTEPTSTKQVVYAEQEANVEKEFLSISRCAQPDRLYRTFQCTDAFSHITDNMSESIWDPIQRSLRKLLWTTMIPQERAEVPVEDPFNTRPLSEDSVLDDDTFSVGKALRTLSHGSNSPGITPVRTSIETIGGSSGLLPMPPSETESRGGDGSGILITFEDALPESREESTKAFGLRRGDQSRVVNSPDGQSPQKLRWRDSVRRKIVVVGDSTAGKTHIAKRYVEGKGPSDGPSTVSESYTVDIEVDGTHVELALWDTGGRNQYDHLRPMSYLNAHTVLLCFAIDEPDSLANVVAKWHPEILKFCSKNVPIILVGTKQDLRWDFTTGARLYKIQQFPVTPSRGEDLQRTLGAFQYLECSAKTGEGVTEVFEQATRAALVFGTVKRRRHLLNLF